MFNCYATHVIILQKTHQEYTVIESFVIYAYLTGQTLTKFFKDRTILYEGSLNVIYCEINRIRGGSIFDVLMDSPPPQIYIIKKTKFERLSFLTETDASTKLCPHE